MHKTLVDKMIRSVLVLLDISLQLTPEGTFVGLFQMDGVGRQKAEIEFVEDGNYITAVFYLRISPMDEVKKSMFKEKLSRISDLPEFFENGERWMRMMLSADPTHIMSAAKIKLDEGEFDESDILWKFTTMFSIMKRNWPQENS